jgi:hypothetical protein
MSEIKNADFRQKLAETLMRQIDWSDSPPQASTFVEVCTKLRSAQNKIRTIRKQANKHRSKFLVNALPPKLSRQPRSTQADD